MEYHKQKAIDYAYQWAMSRNPRYYNFDDLGGDCTNFVSQCLNAGCQKMNYQKGTGWFYISPTNRAPAWTSVEALYHFLTTNKGPGPYGKLIPFEQVQAGDIIQLSFDGNRFTHSSFVVTTYPEVMVAQHSGNYINRPMSTQVYQKIRVIRILGCR